MDRNLLTIAANGNAVPVNVPQIRQQMQTVVAEIEMQVGRGGDPDPIGRLRTAAATRIGPGRRAIPDGSPAHRAIKNPAGKGNGDQLFFTMDEIDQSAVYRQNPIPDPNLEVIGRRRLFLIERSIATADRTRLLLCHICSPPFIPEAEKCDDTLFLQCTPPLPD